MVSDLRPSDWSSYLARFHDEHAGITEQLLTRATDERGVNPYEWLAAELTGDGPTIEVGCGSGPLAGLQRGWIGVDRSQPELRSAASMGRSPLLCASADALPLADGAAATVVAPMSLMVVADPPAVLHEVRRVLRPGGTFAALLPARRPMAISDGVRWARLLFALGRHDLPFPHPEVARRPRRNLAPAGLELQQDGARRFHLRVPDEQGADLLLDSLYLPGIAPGRLDRARTLVRRWAPAGIDLPLRRIVATAGDPR